MLFPFSIDQPFLTISYNVVPQCLQLQYLLFPNGFGIQKCAEPRLVECLMLPQFMPFTNLVKPRY